LAVTLAWISQADNGSAAQPNPAGRLKIVATTSLIAEIVADVGGAAVEIATLIPPASCPGHFDIKPNDMKLLADARVFFLHNWQGRTFSDGIIRASGILSTWLGLSGSYLFHFPSGATIVLVSTSIFIAAAACSPKRRVKKL
jgi:hypothetical protein